MSGGLEDTLAVTAGRRRSGATAELRENGLAAQVDLVAADVLPPL